MKSSRSCFFLSASSLLLIALIATGQSDPTLKNYKVDLLRFPVPETAIELIRKNSFPSPELADQGVFIVDGRSIEGDSNENIYVVDGQENRILVFEPTGRYVRSFGRSGQGPGEFQLPTKIRSGLGSRIWVWDSRNSRMQVFDGEGRYTRSQHIFRGMYSFIVDSEGRIIAATPPVDPYDDQAPLISVFSPEGKLLKEFGYRLKDFKNNLYRTSYLAPARNDEVFLAFRNMPVIRKYSPEGDLIHEFEILDPLWQDVKKHNAENQKLLDEKKRVSWASSIKSIKTDESSLYVLMGIPRLEIREFDFQGRLLAIYWYPKPEEYTWTDFTVIKSHGKKYFYVLQNYLKSEPRVDVYTIKSQEET